MAEKNLVATAFEAVSAPAVNFGTKSVWVSGRLVRTDSGAGIADAKVSAMPGSSSKALTTNTTVSGKFAMSVDTASLKVGTSDVVFSYEGDKKQFDAAQAYTLTITVNPAAVIVEGVIVEDKEYDGTTKATLNLASHELVGVPDGAEDIQLETKAAEAAFVDKNAGTGKPVTVTGLELAREDEKNCTLVSPELTASISPRPLTVNGVTARDKPSDGTTEARLNFDNATLSGVLDGDDVCLDSSAAEGSFADPGPGANKKVTVSGLSLTGPDADNYTVNQPTATAEITAARPAASRPEPGNNLGSAIKRVMQDSKVNTSVAQVLSRVSASLKGNSKVGPEVVQTALDNIVNAIAGNDAVQAKCEPCNGQIRLSVRQVDTNTKDWKDAKLLNEEVLGELARQVRLLNDSFEVVSGQPVLDGDSLLFDRVSVGVVSIAWTAGITLLDHYVVKRPDDQDFKRYRRSGKTAAAAQWGFSSATGSATALAPTPTFQAQVDAGQCTNVCNFIAPALAHVRCLCRLTEEGCCSGGKEYIESVCITASRGEIGKQACATGPDGSSEFDLPKGWYTFSAPEEIVIGGCNYELCCGSPISAYVGPGQSCSDIVFSYRKGSNEIVLDALICHPDINDPDQEVAPENFPGMQYLLLRDCDQTFVQQQTSTDGSPVYFQNLPAGTYSIYCQAPQRWGTLPVKPVNPEGGRMTLRVFAGQANPIPVPVIFHTCDRAPAVLDGYVTDETGQAMPQQLVKVVNRAGSLVAVGVTDTTGQYLIQVYCAEDVTVIANGEQIQYSRKQLQSAMAQIVKPGPEYAKKLLGGLLDSADIPGLATVSND